MALTFPCFVSKLLLKRSNTTSTIIHYLNTKIVCLILTFMVDNIPAENNIWVIEGNNQDIGK